MQEESEPRQDAHTEDQPAEEIAPDVVEAEAQPPAENQVEDEPVADVSAADEVDGSVAEVLAGLDDEEGPAPGTETPEGEAVAAPEEGTDIESGPEAEVMAAPVVTVIPWWPFWLLTGLWVGVVGGTAYILSQASDVPAYQHEYYPAIVLAGIVLTLLGPVVATVTWAVVRKDAPKGERGGLFVTAILRSAAITLLGVLAWWGVLVAVDALRLGYIRI